VLGKNVIAFIHDNTLVDIIQYSELHSVEFWLLQGATVDGTSQVLFNTFSWTCHSPENSIAVIDVQSSTSLWTSMTLRKLMTAV